MSRTDHARPARRPEHADTAPKHQPRPSARRERARVASEVAAETAVCCDELRTCAPCGDDVCAEHSAEVASCVEVGIHHLTCVSACTDCSRTHAQDVADDLASGYTTERGR